MATLSLPLASPPLASPSAFRLPAPTRPPNPGLAASASLKLFAAQPRRRGDEESLAFSGRAWCHGKREHKPSGAAAVAGRFSPKPRLPSCPSLKIVAALQHRRGDEESSALKGQGGCHGNRGETPSGAAAGRFAPNPRPTSFPSLKIGAAQLQSSALRGGGSCHGNTVDCDEISSSAGAAGFPRGDEESSGLRGGASSYGNTEDCDETPSATGRFLRREALGLGAAMGIAAAGFGMEASAISQCAELTMSPSGLAFCDTAVGSGIQASKGLLIRAHYSGKLESGKVFDSSYTRGKPLVFRIGVGEVIRGWDQGILGADGIPPMLAGGKRTLRIPPQLGYGERGAGCRGGSCLIPPNSVLVFDVEFVGKA